MPIQTHRRRQHHPKMKSMENVNIYGDMATTENPQHGSVEFDENDEKIISATLKAFESGSLTPLIKEELRCTIQSRRIAEGKGEMKVEFKTPLGKKEMNDEERKRALKRRQQNREAAQRFRQRQKDTSDYLTAKISKLEKSAKALMTDMTRLKEEKELLGQMLKDHMAVCSNPNISNHSIVSSNCGTPEIPAIPETPCQTPLSASSNDSHFTYANSPSSTTFYDTSIQSPASDIQENSFTQMSEVNPEDFRMSFNSDENVIVLDGPVDKCYEEIVIDFIDPEMDIQNGSRARGDSCSSVDTVSSVYCSSTPDVNVKPIPESDSELHYIKTVDYSQILSDFTNTGGFDGTGSMVDNLCFLEDL